MSTKLAVAGPLCGLALLTCAGNPTSIVLPPEGAGSLRLELVQSGFASPVYLASPPGDTARLFVVEQTGRIQIVQHGQLLPAAFLDIHSRLVSGGEQGLLSVAFHPSYAANGFFYVNYTDLNGDTRVERYTVSVADSNLADTATHKLILFIPQPYSNHNGGMVLFGPDGLLYIGLGDGGSGGDPENRAQNMASMLGKLFTLDIRKPGVKPTIVALGLRNPWRYSFDRKTGDLWIGDVGQGSIEEIDRLSAGTTGLVNFGWDVYEGRQGFEDKALGPGALIQPVTQYSHDDGCSVTGGYVNRGPGAPALRGRYVFGDYCSGRVWSIPATAKEGKLREEPFRVESLSSFGEDLDGRLYVLSHRGTLYRIS